MMKHKRRVVSIAMLTPSLLSLCGVYASTSQLSRYKEAALKQLAQKGKGSNSSSCGPQSHVGTVTSQVIIDSSKPGSKRMRLLQKVCTVASVGLLLSAVFAIGPLVASAQGQKTCLAKSIAIVDYGPKSATTGTSVTLEIALTGHCNWSDGTQSGGAESGAQVYFAFNGQNFGPYTTDDSGIATGPQVVFSSTGPQQFSVSVVDDTNGQHSTTSGTYPVSVSGGESTPTATPATPTPATPTPATPTPATPTPATPTPTPKVATPTPQQATPVSSAQVQTAVQAAGGGTPSSVTWGTGPTGDPQATVTQKPGPNLLRTTIIDFASSPENNTANYNKLVTDSLSNGWTLTAQGHRTYSNANENYQYSRFSKGKNVLNLAAQGPNATGKLLDIPTDQSTLISQEDQTYGDTGISLFGLSGVPAWLAIGGIVAAAAVIVIALWYDRQKKEPDEEQSTLYDHDETAPYKERDRRL